MYRILVIDDDREACASARSALAARGHQVTAVDASVAIGLLVEQDFDVVIAAQPPVQPPPPQPSAPLSVPQEMIWLAKPLSEDAVVDAVREVEQRVALRQTLDGAERALVEHLDSPIVGASPAIRAVLARIRVVGPSDAPVLVSGESGTGKELVARAIHARSARRDRPIVAVNCAAFPESLIDAELFGHERGAFTGAQQRRDGCFQTAHGGTLFLDEIHELSPAAQAKLLRVLQDGSFHPIGSDAESVVDVRVISASNVDLRTRIAEGTFREDLYYRIRVLDIDVPPLRAREGDLPLLVAYFLLKHASPGRRPSVSPAAWAALCQHPFPGNVRELEHAIQHALILACGSDITPDHLPREIVPVGDAGREPIGELRPLAHAVREFEREYLRRALVLTNGNKSHAARMLGMSRKNLWDKLRRFEP